MSKFVPVAHLSRWWYRNRFPSCREIPWKWRSSLDWSFFFASSRCRCLSACLARLTNSSWPQTWSTVLETFDSFTFYQVWNHAKAEIALIPPVASEFIKLLLLFFFAFYLFRRTSWSLAPLFPFSTSSPIRFFRHWLCVFVFCFFLYCSLVRASVLHRENITGKKCPRVKLSSFIKRCPSILAEWRITWWPTIVCLWKRRQSGRNVLPTQTLWEYTKPFLQAWFKNYVQERLNLTIFKT